MSVYNLLVKIGGDAQGVQKALEGTVNGVKDAFGRIGEIATGNLVSDALSNIGGAMVDYVKDTIDALGKVESINAQTAAALKSTGGAAGVTAEHISELAGHLERMTGIEAEGIQQGQNLLLTFTNIKNGVGAGNDIFDQTTKIMVDMATAMGTDVKGGAIQLGKALNDPIQGVSALSRVGVTFDEQTKSTIKSLVESGKTMDAQKIILAELNKEFGGSAEAVGKTLPMELKKLENAYGDVGEAILGESVPALKAFVSVTTGVLSGIADTISSKGLGGAIASVFSPEVTAVIIGIATALTASFAPAAITAATAFTTSMIPAITAAVAAAAPFIAAGAAIAGAAYLIMKNWGPISGFFTGLWNGVLGGIQGFVNKFSGAFGFIGKIVETVMDFVKDKLKFVWGLLPEGFRSAIEGATANLGKLPTFVAGTVDTVKTTVTQGFASIGGAMGGPVQQGAAAVSTAMGGTVKKVQEHTAAIKTAVMTNFAGVFAEMRQIDGEAAFFGDTTAALQKKINAAAEGIRKAMAFTGPMTAAQAKDFEQLKRIYKDLTDQLAAVKTPTVDVQAVLKDMETSLSNAGEAAKVWGDSTGGVEEKQRILKDVIDKLIPTLGSNSDVISGLKQRYDDLGSGVDKAKKPFDKFKSSTTDLLQAVKGLQDGVATIGKAFGIELNDPVSQGIVNFGNAALSVFQVTTSVQSLLPALAGMATSIGSVVIPAVMGAATAIGTALMGALGTMAGIITTTVIPVVWGFTAALLANPIFWIPAVIAAAIVAIAAIARYWDQITGFLGAAWNGMVEGLKGAIQAFPDFMKGLWDGIVSTAKGVWEGLAGFIKTLWDGIMAILKAPYNLIITGINWVIEGLNKIQVKIPDWVPGIGGKGFGINIPTIPYLADGGIAVGPTQAMIGEGGDPEAVLPLNQSTFDALGAAIAASLGQQGGSKSGDTHFHITIQAGAFLGDEAQADEYARQIGIRLNRMQLRTT